MFMCSPWKYKIGERDVGLSHGDEDTWEDIPFVVLREATREEWLEEEIKSCPKTPIEELKKWLVSDPYCYLISVD